jgi:hypothetical protein
MTRIHMWLTGDDRSGSAWSGERGSVSRSKALNSLHLSQPVNLLTGNVAAGRRPALRVGRILFYTPPSSSVLASDEKTSVVPFQG